MAEKKAGPVLKLRDGALSVTVWKNEREVEYRGKKENKTFYSVDLKRSYKDGEDWKDTSSIDYQSAPRAAVLLNSAYNAIVEIRAKAGEKDEE
jgi:hypothetical protein